MISCTSASMQNRLDVLDGTNMWYRAISCAPSTGGFVRHQICIFCIHSTDMSSDIGILSRLAITRASLPQALTYTGSSNTSLPGNLAITGSLAVAGSLSVAGVSSSTLTSTSVPLTGTLTAIAASIGSVSKLAIDTSGNATTPGTVTALQVTGSNASITGSLTCLSLTATAVAASTASISGSLTSAALNTAAASITGSATVNGNLTVNGSLSAPLNGCKTIQAGRCCQEIS